SRLALATLVIQDMLVLAMLAALPVIAQWAGKGAVEPIILEAPPADRTGWPATVLDGVVRLAGIAVLAILGRLVLPRVLRESLRGRSTEVMMVAGVAVALASAVAAEALGFSLEMGAFLGGFILAGTSVRYQLSAQIAPLRDVFLAVFFTTVGMRLDPQVVMQYWWAILLGLTVMIALKTLAISGACWTFGASASIALAVGVALSQGGEFSLILLNQAHAFGLLNEKTTAIAIAVIVMSLILTPGLIAFGRRLASAASGLRAAPWIGGSEMKDGAPGKSEEDGSRRHWIIAGYGPIGQSVAQKLDQTGIPYVVIELNPKTVDEQSRMGKSFIFGDVANPDVLISAGVNEAGGLVLTIPDEEAVLRACAIGRTHVPDLYILARLHSLSRAPEAVRLGTSEVTIDESQTAEGILKAVTNRVEGGASSGAAKPDPVPVER
ncbi:MAG: cation:proton antiporter, partial [Phycisphaerae bacterium]|nr:cation:proton antiporter [Phycisphaerae bacterium]